MNRSVLGQALCGLALFFTQTPHALAGSFAVNPVRVTLSAKRPVAAITVRNTGAEATLVQLDTVRWSQEDGKNELTPSSEVLATPPIFTIPANGAQIIRIGLRRPADARRELTYRLILREVPPPDPAPQALRITLQVSMPVFIEPSVATAPALHWRAMRTREGQIRLLASNSGNAHVQLGRLDLTLAGNGQPVGTHRTADYVLPDNQRTWIVDAKPVPAVGTLLRVSTQTDAGKVQSDVVLEDDAAEFNAAALPTASR
jgi:fimbrial chaperone protein